MNHYRQELKTRDFKEQLSAEFLRSVARYPENIALWVDEKAYTYTELWKQVYSIYKELATDVEHERIGIYCNDDIFTYASILAVNIYGAAYVPLNNKYPPQRNKKIAELTGLKLILASRKNDDVIVIAEDAQVITAGEIKEESVFNLSHNISSFKIVHQPYAYVLFTSGSTGEPKGVEITNENVNHCFDFFFKNYDLTETDRFLQASELTFDFSVFSFFMPLNIGAACYVLSGDRVRFVKIVQMLQKHKITVLSMVPSILRFLENYMEEITLPCLRFCFLSGDALYRDLALKWSKSLSNGEIHNFYGTTETAIVCTRYIFNPEHDLQTDLVPLGKPFEGIDMIIVDDNNNLCVKGDLAIAGPQVIAGYLGVEKDSKFITLNDKLYYKPGDIVSRNKNGDLVYHGRADNQVKIKGYRVELGEIETAINKIINKKCIVIAFKDERQMTQLKAFIETEEVNEKALAERLLKELPEHMVPQRIEAVRKFSLSINGKIDKSELVKSF